MKADNIGVADLNNNPKSLKWYIQFKNIYTLVGDTKLWTQMINDVAAFWCYVASINAE